MRKALVVIILGGAFSFISYLFWYNEWKYSLPTPVPKEYKNVMEGAVVDLGGRLTVDGGKPMLIHFFNPECPCSRFNIKHFKSLVKQYGAKVSFAVVVVNKAENYSEEEIQEKFGLDLPVSFDLNIANACGVYSTPQAVLLDKDRKLYYKGNYNKSRYCTDKNSNYAQMAIDSLLQDRHDIAFSPYALKAYGCELPTCKK